MSGSWAFLVDRYKDDRLVCNCREAWYGRSGETQTMYQDGRWVTVPVGARSCPNGCSANKIFCRNEIARRVCAEFKKLGMKGDGA